MLIHMCWIAHEFPFYLKKMILDSVEGSVYKDSVNSGGISVDLQIFYIL